MWLLWEMLSARLGQAAQTGKQGWSTLVRKGLNLNEKLCQIRGDIRKFKDFHGTLSSFYR